MDICGMPKTDTKTFPSAIWIIILRPKQGTNNTGRRQLKPAKGNYYNRARYMLTGLGRFNRQDDYRGEAVNPPSLHRYQYVFNNPVNLTDPSGKALLGFLIYVASIIVIVTKRQVGALLAGWVAPLAGLILSVLAWLVTAREINKLGCEHSRAGVSLLAVKYARIANNGLFIIAFLFGLISAVNPQARVSVAVMFFILGLLGIGILFVASPFEADRKKQALQKAIDPLGPRK